MSAQELVRETCALLSSSGGNGITYLDHNLFKVYLDILCGLFRFNDEIPTETRQAAMSKCILGIARSGPKSDIHLARLLRQEEQVYLQTTKTSFVLLSSVSLKYNQQIKRVSAPTATLTFYPARPSSFPLPDGGSVRVKDATPSGYSYVKAHVQARDHWGAAEAALHSLDLLRSLWNLYYNRRISIRETWISDGGWTPVNAVPPGPIHTLHTHAGKLALDGVWWTSYMPKETKPKPIGSEYVNLKKFERFVRNQIRNSHYGHKLEKFLVRYVRALDSYDATTTLINLWSTLEEIAGVKSVGDSSKLIKRATFLDYKPKQGRLLLEFIRDHRNMIAHAGATPDEIERLIYILKFYVEGLLWYVIRNAQKHICHEDLLGVLDLSVDPDEIRADMQRLKDGLQLRLQAST
ncbi:hypothetical protein [Cyanobium sp. ULC082]